MIRNTENAYRNSFRQEGKEKIITMLRRKSILLNFEGREERILNFQNTDKLDCDKYIEIKVRDLKQEFNF